MSPTAELLQYVWNMPGTEWNYQTGLKHASVFLVRHVTISLVFLSLALSVLEFSKRQPPIKKVEMLFWKKTSCSTSSVAGQKQLQEKKLGKIKSEATPKSSQVVPPKL